METRGEKMAVMVMLLSIPLTLAHTFMSAQKTETHIKSSETGSDALHCSRHTRSSYLSLRYPSFPHSPLLRFLKKFQCRGECGMLGNWTCHPWQNCRRESVMKLVPSLAGFAVTAQIRFFHSCNTNLISSLLSKQ